MKILVMGTGQGMGGLRTHLKGLLQFLVSEGQETGIIVVADSEVDFPPPPGVTPLSRIPHQSTGLWQKLRKYGEIRRCKAKVRRFQPDVFVATAPGRGYATVASSARRNGAFTIWQSVTNPPHLDSLSMEMSRSADAIAVQTPGMLAPFRHAIPAGSRMGCLPCFFEPPQAEDTAHIPTGEEPVRLAYFGRLAGNKGLTPFLHVIPQALRRHPLRFDIHGAGSERGALEKTIAELGLGDVVRLMGRYPEGAEYGRLLTSYHALVMPSIDCEGLPLVLVEGMSCGLPFLATNIGGIPDAALENPDVVVTGPTHEALTHGLIRLLELLRTGQISNSRLKAYYERHFSPESVAQAWRRMLVDPKAFFSSV